MRWKMVAGQPDSSPTLQARSTTKGGTLVGGAKPPDALRPDLWA